MLAVLASAAAYAPLHRAPPKPRVLVTMCDPASASRHAPNVTIATQEVKELLTAEEALTLLREEDERRDAAISALFEQPPSIEGETQEESTAKLSYFAERHDLVGKVDSSELLNRDEEAGIWPAENLPHGDRHTDADMLWVDELSCIGCTWCADVARSTFRVQDGDYDYGQARVIQQGGDVPETVQEAIDCCPVSCIMKCTRDELELLEAHRSLGHIDDLLARHNPGVNSLGWGAGSFAVPHWKDPITHQGWRKGDKYMKTRRLQMANPLLHESGSKTSMSLIGLKAGKGGGWKASPKVNDAPSPIAQDGTVIPHDAPAPKDQP